MVIIITELIFITIPIVIFVLYKSCNVKLKKLWLIIPEFIVITVLLFAGFKIILDIPYIAKGGVLSDESIAYITETGAKFNITTISTSSEKYWAIGDSRMFEKLGIHIQDLYDNSDVVLYVLPNTKLVYRMEYIGAFFEDTLYSIYDFNFELLDLCIFEIFLIWAFFKCKKNIRM